MPRLCDYAVREHCKHEFQEKNKRRVSMLTQMAVGFHKLFAPFLIFRLRFRLFLRNCTPVRQHVGIEISIANLVFVSFCGAAMEEYDAKPYKLDGNDNEGGKSSYVTGMELFVDGGMTQI